LGGTASHGGETSAIRTGRGYQAGEDRLMPSV